MTSALPQPDFTVLDAAFLPATEEESPGAMDVIVRGRGFVDRAVPLAARLGDQELTDVVIAPSGSGFSAVIPVMPRPGDRLHVGYMDRPMRETSVVYESSFPQV